MTSDTVDPAAAPQNDRDRALAGIAVLPPSSAAKPPPVPLDTFSRRAVFWARENLFKGWVSTLVTIGLIYLLINLFVAIVEWGILTAVWAPDAEACRSPDSGACWGVVNEKIWVIFFGAYPFDEQWRPFLMMAMLIGMSMLSMIRRFWRKELLFAWAIAAPVMAMLMFGGVFGLEYVSTERWGGLPLTMILAFVGIVFAFPLSLLLALGRRSDLPAIRAICVGFIEIIRGVPLISVLFMASFMIPLFLPEGVNFDKLLRAQIGIILFISAYLAETIRGGLQAVPKGQVEAADSLGLSYWQSMRFIVLPQALRLVIPPMVSTFISLFKDTSLVLIIGLIDFLAAIRVAHSEPQWQLAAPETYIFASLVYFTFCYSFARYGAYIERYTRRGERR